MSLARVFSLHLCRWHFFFTTLQKWARGAWIKSWLPGPIVTPYFERRTFRRLWEREKRNTDIYDTIHPWQSLSFFSSLFKTEMETGIALLCVLYRPSRLATPFTSPLWPGRVLSLRIWYVVMALVGTMKLGRRSQPVWHRDNRNPARGQQRQFGQLSFYPPNKYLHLEQVEAQFFRFHLRSI